MGAKQFVPAEKLVSITLSYVWTMGPRAIIISPSTQSDTKIDIIEEENDLVLIKWWSSRQISELKFFEMSTLLLQTNMYLNGNSVLDV